MSAEMTLDAAVRAFPDIPRSVLLKADLLRHGFQFGQVPLGSRHYHHHDERGQKGGVPAQAHIQGSVRLPDGTTVFMAHNPVSPYTILSDPDGGQPSLWVSGTDEKICDLLASPRLRWTSQRTTSDTPMASVFTPSLGGGCGPLAIFLLRHCEFVVDNEECRFCSWVRMGKSREMRPNVDDLRETLGAIWDEQRAIGYLAFSGGSLFDRTKEADAFLTYMHAVRETGVKRPPTVAAIQALDPADSQRLRDAGFDYACYSMEVWAEELWKEIVPGKTRSVGREHWMKCLTDAVKIFGEGHVLCNFVAGVELAVPGLYATPEAAADATLEGMRWCCDHGIYPRYAVWIVQGGAQFSDQKPAPLEYYARLMVGRQELYREYGMPVPATDCVHCLTQSCEADLARLDPGRYAIGAAGRHDWDHAHPMAHGDGGV